RNPPSIWRLAALEEVVPSPPATPPLERTPTPSAPAVMRTVPPYVLALARLTRPAPILVSPPGPETLPVMLRLAPEAAVTVESTGSETLPMAVVLPERPLKVPPLKTIFVSSRPASGQGGETRV